jgi:CheY-like chemotaxis protein
MADVLLVEDEPDLRDLMERLLRGGGHDVRPAPDGRAALAEMTRCVPDVVLLDLAMPVMDGAAMLEALRSYVRFRDVPVVVVTALPPTDPSVIRAQVAGIQGLFHKGSFGFDQLLDHVATLV